jgi:hypothetical protein
VLSVLVCIEIRPSTELGTKIWLNPHQDQARQGAIPALFSRMGFVRDSEFRQPTLLPLEQTGFEPKHALYMHRF